MPVGLHHVRGMQLRLVPHDPGSPPRPGDPFATGDVDRQVLFQGRRHPEAPEPGCRRMAEVVIPRQGGHCLHHLRPGPLPHVPEPDPRRRRHQGRVPQLIVRHPGRTGLCRGEHHLVEARWIRAVLGPLTPVGLQCHVHGHQHERARRTPQELSTGRLRSRWRVGASAILDRKRDHNQGGVAGQSSAMTSSSICSVKRPVKVFCWETW
ncbi:hypothetical protein ACFFX0_09685 [Citricoccus parietis]|uniref:Uncharacterized protein n=1 Tax=Citricoccus parietis TaxID=592307 RepID=A0ABV5FXU1_9MICC